MKDIEKIIEKVSREEFEIPPKVQYRVQYTLKNKTKKKNYHFIKKFVAIIASLAAVFVGGISVYGVCGGTISGKPIFEWLGSNFDTEYENYKTEVENQKVLYGQTSIELLSKMYDDGMVILEFDVKIGEEDMKTFDIQENQILKGIYLTFNGASNNWIATIDNKEYGIKTRSAQSYTQIAENEYKVYHMYFLTDKELKNKTDFNINILYTYIDPIVQNIGETQEYETFHVVCVDGRMDIPFSKNQLAENTYTFVPKCESIKYKNMTKTVENVTVTPMQIICKVSSKMENVTLASIASTTHEDYIGLMQYAAYDQNGNEIGIKSYQTLNQITYSNGKSEEWDIGDIGTYKNFKNATMELMEYFIIERKEESSDIKVIAQEIIDDTIDGRFVQTYKDIGNFEIDLKNK